jgi:hypothetical protein
MDHLERCAVPHGQVEAYRLGGHQEVELREEPAVISFMAAASRDCITPIYRLAR